MGADTRNIADGKEIRVKVQSATRQITELTGKVQDGRVEVEWEIEAFEDEPQEEKEQEQRKQERENRREKLFMFVIWKLINPKPSLMKK